MKILVATMACALSVGSAWAADQVSAVDRAFVAKVSQGGMFEVALGQLASTQAVDQDIKDQGATEAHDHMLVGAKLKDVASDAGITFPDTLNAQFQAQLDGIRAKSGDAFDAAYLKAMVVIHDKDGAAFAAEAKNGTDPKLRAFAAETHRIVLRHLGEIKAVGP